MDVLVNSLYSSHPLGRNMYSPIFFFSNNILECFYISSYTLSHRHTSTPSNFIQMLWGSRNGPFYDPTITGWRFNTVAHRLGSTQTLSIRGLLLRWNQLHPCFAWKVCSVKNYIFIPPFIPFATYPYTSPSVLSGSVYLPFSTHPILRAKPATFSSVTVSSTLHLQLVHSFRIRITSNLSIYSYYSSFLSHKLHT